MLNDCGVIDPMDTCDDPHACTLTAGHAASVPHECHCGYRYTAATCTWACMEARHDDCGMAHCACRCHS